MSGAWASAGRAAKEIAPVNNSSRRRFLDMDCAPFVTIGEQTLNLLKGSGELFRHRVDQRFAREEPPQVLARKGDHLGHRRRGRPGRVWGQYSVRDPRPAFVRRRLL